METDIIIDPNNIPQHVAIIMDGNGRWAKAQGKNRAAGHTAGAKSVKSSIVAAVELGIKYLTVYAFSTENWRRPASEINGLMNLLVKSIDNELDEINRNGVKINFLGQLERLPLFVRNKVKYALETTKDNCRLYFNMAISYSGRWDIVTAAKRLASDCAAGKLRSNDIDESLFARYLSTAGFPDPELLIRTSGENRISNFLLFQAAYTELYFTDVFWPDFDKNEFYRAIHAYQQRERRFGKTGEQIKQQN